MPMRMLVCWKVGIFGIVCKPYYVGYDTMLLCWHHVTCVLFAMFGILNGKQHNIPIAVTCRYNVTVFHYVFVLPAYVYNL